MRTYYRCDVCGKIGEVIHDAHADIYTVIQKLEDDHAGGIIGKDCLFDLSMVRVNPKKPPPIWRTAKSKGDA